MLQKSRESLFGFQCIGFYVAKNLRPKGKVDDIRASLSVYILFSLSRAGEGKALVLLNARELQNTSSCFIYVLHIPR